MSVSEFPADDRPDGSEVEYRPLCGLALVAFGLAVLSLSAWITMAMLCMSLITAVVAMVALRRIAASDPPMLGRKLALAALFLSVTSGVGVAVDWYTYRMRVGS